MNGSTPYSESEDLPDFGNEKAAQDSPTVPGETLVLWREGKPYRYAPPNNGDPWTECLNSVRKYDDEKCRGWNQDIDTLLVFAGLFSATVTAFTAESYQWLQDSTQNAILTQLIHVSASLNASVSPLPAPSVFSPSAASIRINTFWFLSLTISLATVLLGILCKQWLREYQKDALVSHQLALELRQMRYESLQRWGVPGILSALPLLLQLALVLFFAGMLDLLWSLHPVVAGFVSAVVGLSMSIVVITSVLPACHILAIQRRRSASCLPFPCAYKSPQSWLFHRLLLTFNSLWSRRSGHYAALYSDWVSFDLHLLRTQQYLSLGDSDPSFLQRGLRWIVVNFGDSVSMARQIFHCLQSCSTQEFAYATHQDSDSTLDTLNLKFLDTHSWDESDFAIRQFAIELSLRQLNDPTGSPASASGLLRNLIPLVDRDGGPDLGEELWNQIIASMRNHLSTDRACVDDVYPLLEIFQSCWPPSSQALRQHAYLFLDEFQGWIERTTQTGLLRTRISEIVCSLTRSIHYMVHYFATDLITSSRFVEFAKFVDGRAILLGIDTRSLRTGRSTWQEAKRILVTRSSLPPDFFPMSPKFPAEIWNPAASSSRLPDSSYHGSSVNDLPRSTEDDRRSTFSLPPDSRSCSVEEL